MTREDIQLYIMGQYDGDIAALERAIATDPALAQIAAEEARLEELLRDAATAATFCPACDDLVRGPRCDTCGAAVKPGGYTVERVLVSNAHGRMYVARDADGRRVALKELAFVQAPSPGAVAAFEREARFLRALEHPAIPRFLASFEEGSGVHTRYYLAQELVEGTSLDHLDEHWYTEAEITALARQVLEVIVYLQSLSPMVIHRDIKPANLIKRADGSIALVDFGAAHVHGTTAGVTTIGTFGYMPIEQLAGIVDATTDGYALGMTLLHLLTRQEPWKLAQQRTSVNVSAPLRAFLDRLTAPEPKHRFASAKDALAALERPVALVPRRSRRPALLAAMAGVAFVAAGGGVFAVAHHHHHHASAPTPALPRMPVHYPNLSFATLHVELHDGVEGVLTLDGRRFGTVHAGQWIPIPAGTHHATITSLDGGGACTQDFTIEGGGHEMMECALVQGRPPHPRLHADKHVTWRLHQVKLRDFVLLAAGTCGFSAVLPESLSAAVTVDVKDAPCDQTFEVVLEAEGLDYAYDPAANLVRVAARHDLDDEPATADLRAHDELPAGKSVSLDVKDAPLREILDMLIAGSGGTYNLIIPDGLDANVTIRLADVPWNHAFEAVLAANGLWYRYRDNGKLIRIAARHDLEDGR
jgi:hypothetical protein